MWQSLKRPVAWMLVGGFLVIMGIGIGQFLAQESTSSWSEKFPGLPEKIVHAATATSGENFALATGLIDEEAEGVFVLDFVTGNLQCSVLNQRTGKFSAQFRANVAKDLGTTKNGTYQMVTGALNFHRGASAVRPGLSVVYVLDGSSGRMMAYGIPWQRDAAATGRAQIGLLQPIDALQVRNVSIREQ